MRRPAVVAIANYFYPGLGYVLLGQRRTFGWLLMLGFGAQILQIVIDPLPYIVVYGSSVLSVTLGTLAIFILQIAFAYDAYHLAKRS